MFLILHAGVKVNEAYTAEQAANHVRLMLTLGLVNVVVTNVRRVGVPLTPLEKP